MRVSLLAGQTRRAVLSAALCVAGSLGRPAALAMDTATFGIPGQWVLKESRAGNLCEARADFLTDRPVRLPLRAAQTPFDAMRASPAPHSDATCSLSAPPTLAGRARGRSHGAQPMRRSWQWPVESCGGWGGADVWVGPRL